MQIINTLPPSNGTDTSNAAAVAVSGKAASDRALVYAMIAARGTRGMTCSEYMHATGADHAGSSARFWELSGGNDPYRYPILIAYMGEKRPTLDANGEPKRTKARVYVALSTLPDHVAIQVRSDERARIVAKTLRPAG